MKIGTRVAAFLSLAAAALIVSAFSAGAPARTVQTPVRSWPPDTNNYSRPAIPEDFTEDVRGVGPSIFLSDANSADNNDGSEPSIAIDPCNTNTIVIHGGFGGWNGNARLFRSTNGGTSWSALGSVPPPPGATGTIGCPCDTAVDFGPASLLAGAFLTADFTFGENVFSGSNTASSLSNAASWSWPLVMGNAQMTNLAATSVGSADQPWLLVNRDPGDASKSRVYVAYDDFGLTAGGLKLRVAATPLTNPPVFSVDNAAGPVTGGVNPGHRLANDPGSGTMYDLYQFCSANCSSDPKTIQYVLNRSTDGGLTWTLNASSVGIVVATAESTQPTPKFGTVNALLGGVDHAAVDPTTGDVYVVYGNRDAGTFNNRLAIRRLVSDGAGGLTVGAEHFVTGQVQAALPSVAVATDGTVGVLWDSFDGIPMSGFPSFTAHLSISGDKGVTFMDNPILSFLSPATDNADSRQRVLGDYQQMKAVGEKVFGVFSGNRVAAVGGVLSIIDPIFFSATIGTGATPTPTISPTPTPSRTPTPTVSQTPTPTVSATPTASVTPTPTPTATPVGVPSLLTVKPVVVNFGNVKVGRAKFKTLTLGNAATTGPAITFGNPLASVPPSNPQEFGFPAGASTCPAQLLPKKKCKLRIELLPSTTGPKASAVTIFDNAANANQVVPLIGNGK